MSSKSFVHLCSCVHCWCMERGCLVIDEYSHY